MVDVDEQMRQKAEELYGRNARNSSAILIAREGCEILDRVTTELGWTQLVDEDLEYGVVPFLQEQRNAVDSALSHLMLNRFANDGTFDTKTSQARLGDLMGRMGHVLEVRYLSDLSQANHEIPYVQYQFDLPMAKAMDSFLKHRNLISERSLDAPLR